MEIPEFGERLPGQTYVDRPGAYGVIFDTQGRVATVRLELDYFLPGGGREPGESPTETLRREALEEAGLTLEDLRPLGKAVDYLRALRSGRCYRIEGDFFAAAWTGSPGQAAEPRHVLIWQEPAEAAARLHRGSQSWAVEKACQMRKLHLKGGPG